MSMTKTDFMRAWNVLEECFDHKYRENQFENIYNFVKDLSIFDVQKVFDDLMVNNMRAPTAAKIRSGFYEIRQRARKVTLEQFANDKDGCRYCFNSGWIIVLAKNQGYRQVSMRCGMCSAAALKKIDINSADTWGGTEYDMKAFPPRFMVIDAHAKKRRDKIREGGDHNPTTTVTEAIRDATGNNETHMGDPGRYPDDPGSASKADPSP